MKLPPTEGMGDSRLPRGSRRDFGIVGVGALVGGIVILLLTPGFGPFSGTAGTAYLIYLVAPGFLAIVAGIFLLWAASRSSNTLRSSNTRRSPWAAILSRDEANEADTPAPLAEVGDDEHTG